MSYRGSEAERLDSREFAQQGARRSFDVVEGAGLDSAARRGVAPERLAAFRLALACVAVFLVLGVARVAVTAATVQTLEANSGLTGQVSAAEDTAKELRIEAAVLSNNSRITTIATENLGMVYAGAGESLTVSVS
ncbi:cell division protein FtsL [Caniella muris]|uniref:cell division protein FtsL n=1 Tax=Caniella muris TaxID=2941502 RepID=UPI0020410996|nr:cell division protein FtsL [Caniella muris]